MATVLNNLAATNAAQDRFTEADRLYRQSLALKEKVFGPEHPEVAQTLMAHAAVLRKLQRAAEADTLEKRAQSIRARSR